MSKLLDTIIENIHNSCYSFGIPPAIPHTRLITGNSDVFYKRLVYSDWYLENLAISHLGIVFRINPLITHRYEDGTVRIADEYQISPDPITPLDIVRIPSYICGIHSFNPQKDFELRLIPLMLRYFFGRVFIDRIFADHVVTNANSVGFGEMINFTRKIDNAPGEYFNDGSY